MDHTGHLLGNYRLTHLLGKGGFADVYLSEHVFLRTLTAIKVLHTQLTEDSMSSFLTEAQTIARLRHPNIIRVLDFGVHDNTPYLVMDYAPKGTLRQLHPKGSRLSLPMVVHYAKQVAEALHYAHGEKFIHRDIKPENMLLGSNNEILLSDFGIATMAQSSRYQMTQDVVGTVAYMAPEQIQGKPRPVSDEYALGIVIYEWLTGSYPFHGTFTEIASQHVFAPIPSLRETLPALPEDVEQVIAMALAKDPQQRFATLRAFANALVQASGKVTSNILPSDATLIPSANTGPTITPVLFQGELPTFISPSNTGPTRISTPEPIVLAAGEQGTLLPTPTPPNVDTPPTKGKKSERRYTRRMLLGGVGGLAIIGTSAMAWLAMTNNLPFIRAYSSTPTTTKPTTPAPAPTNTTGPTPTATSQPTATPTEPATPSPISPAILTYTGPDNMYTAAWSPNGAWIASAGHGPLVEVWAAPSKSSLFS